MRARREASGASLVVRTRPPPVSGGLFPVSALFRIRAAACAGYGSQMKTASISEAKNRLSAPIGLVRRGETVQITDRGNPVARRVPLLVEQAASEGMGDLRANDQNIVVWWATRVECSSAIARLESPAAAARSSRNAAGWHRHCSSPLR